jgi:hypothetical protein
MPEEFEFETRIPGNVSIWKVNPLNTDSQANSDLFKDLEDLDNLPEITSLEDFLAYVQENLIRFDTTPKNYKKDDYKALLKTINRALFYIYKRDSEIKQAFNNIRYLEIVEEVLTENSTGETVYELSKYPYDKVGLEVYINGILRTGVQLVGKIITLPFEPSIGSTVLVRYYVEIPTIDTALDVEKLNKVNAFMESFILTNKLLTIDGDIVTNNGEYITVDIIV